MILFFTIFKNWSFYYILVNKCPKIQCFCGIFLVPPYLVLYLKFQDRSQRASPWRRIFPWPTCPYKMIPTLDYCWAPTRRNCGNFMVHTAILLWLLINFWEWVWGCAPQKFPLSGKLRCDRWKSRICRGNLLSWLKYLLWLSLCKRSDPVTSFSIFGIYQAKK